MTMSLSLMVLSALVMASMLGLIVTFKRPVPKRWKIGFRIIASVILVLAAGRLVSRQFAAIYGKEMKKAFLTVGTVSFRNTAMFRNAFSKPPMSSWEAGARAFPFFGGRYGDRIEELKGGIFYLSEQASLPAEQRFASPPSFVILHPSFEDHSDAAISKILMALLDEYQTQL